MLKKTLLSIFIFTLVISVVFSNFSFVASAKTVPSKYSGAIVVKTHERFAAGKSVYGQTLTTYYMKPKKARAFANKVENSTSKNIADFLGSSAVGWRSGKVLGKTWPGFIAGGLALMKATSKANVAKDIRKQADKGPVKIVYDQNAYSSGFGKAAKWNGKKINVSSYTEVEDSKYGVSKHVVKYQGFKYLK